MGKPSENDKGALTRNWNRQRESIIGLGERSFRKSFYPELQRRLAELERFRILLDGAVEPIFLIRVSDGMIIDANRSASDFTSLSRDALLQRKVATLYDPDSVTHMTRFFAEGERATRHGITFLGYLKRHPEGQTPVEATVKLANVEGVCYATVLARDVSERMRVEKALVEAKETAERALRLKSQFLNIAAHELRTPVTALSMMLELAQRQVKRGQAFDASTLPRLQGQASRLGRLVVDLLDVSRLERGMVTLVCERADLLSLISSCVEELSLQFPNRKIVFHKPEEPVEMEFDSVRISQVLSNLLDNAIKYTAEEGLIEVGVVAHDQTVRVTVTDQGSGLSEEQRSQLFQPFTRGGTDREERTSGLGLGLFVCRGIVELHGGIIGVESEVGEGSTFFFELPRKCS